METPTAKLIPLAIDLWIQHFPLNLLGGQQGRVTTIIRLSSGQLVIHSTAPFSPADVAGIKALGTPGWLVEAMLGHNTYAKEGRAAFPDIPYLAPPGFPQAGKLGAEPLLPVPRQWAGEIEVIPLEGMPMVNEHALFHAPTRTLIVADLIYNFAPTHGWAAFFQRTLIDVKHSPDVGRHVRFLVRDPGAFARSVEQVMAWDFDRVIVGHSQPILSGGKAALREALVRKEMIPA